MLSANIRFGQVLLDRVTTAITAISTESAVLAKV